MRTPEQRRRDAIEKLEADQDVWVATGDSQGVPHLVPLSLCWADGKIIVAVETTSRTARNAAASGRARLALGHTRDVVMIDADASLVPRPAASAELVSAYRARTGWDPGHDGGDEGWAFLCLTPVRIQVWKDLEEMAGRTVMNNGTWRVGD